MKMRSVLLLSTFSLLAASAVAHLEVYNGIFRGTDESPPNNSPGTGTTTITIDYDLITMRVQSTFSGLTGNTTAAHIHVRPNAQTANGGVATQTPSFVGFPLGVTSGTYDHTFDMALASSYNASFVTANGSVSGAFNALTNAMRAGLTYNNIHTSTFAGGEVRANLVPEPGTWAALGLGSLVLLRARKRK